MSGGGPVSGEPALKGIRRYIVFVCVGAFVTIVSLGLREAIGRAMPETFIFYSFSVGASYFASILLSFSLHRRFTFSASPQTGRPTRQLTKFSGVSIAGLIMTSALSPAIRYGLHLDSVVGSLAGMSAMAVAAFVASIVTYILNATLTFGSPPPQPAEQAPSRAP